MHWLTTREKKGRFSATTHILLVAPPHVAYFFVQGGRHFVITPTYKGSHGAQTIRDQERLDLPYKNVSQTLSQTSDFDPGPCEIYQKFRVPSQNNFSQFQPTYFVKQSSTTINISSRILLYCHASSSTDCCAFSFFFFLKRGLSGHLAPRASAVRSSVCSPEAQGRTPCWTCTRPCVRSQQQHRKRRREEQQHVVRNI